MKVVTNNKEQIDIAIKACKQLNVSFGGVDLLFDKNDEPSICEVNSNAHFKNIFDCTKINVADYIIEYIMEDLYKC